jgi:hypothetical protein
VNFNVYFNVLLIKYIVHPLVKIIKKTLLLLVLSRLSVRLFAWTEVAPNGRIFMKFDI